MIFFFVNPPPGLGPKQLGLNKKNNNNNKIGLMLMRILGKSELRRSYLGKRGRPRNGRTVSEAVTMMMTTRWIFEYHKSQLFYIGRRGNGRKEKIRSGMLQTRGLLLQNGKKKKEKKKINNNKG